jgi:hypothetical protein
MQQEGQKWEETGPHMRRSVPTLCREVCQQMCSSTLYKEVLRAMQRETMSAAVQQASELLNC